VSSVTGPKAPAAAPVLVGLTGVTAVAGGNTRAMPCGRRHGVGLGGQQPPPCWRTTCRTRAPARSRSGGLSQVTAVAGGADAGYALKADGTVWSWGNNDTGSWAQQGHPSATPVQVTGLVRSRRSRSNQQAGYALRGAHGLGVGQGCVRQPWQWRHAQRDAPVQVTGLTNAVGIAAGAASALRVAVGRHGRSWGLNVKGQLGEDR